MSLPDKVIYINLDRRPDRQTQIEDHLKRLGLMDRSIRYSAIEHSVPWIGCTMSHRNVIKRAMDLNLDSVLVLEDDFLPVIPAHDFLRRLGQISSLSFDVALLAHNQVQYTESTPDQLAAGMRRLISAQTASAYWIRKQFFAPLFDNLSQAVESALQNPEMHWVYINDQYWKRLQQDLQYTWLAAEPRMSIQQAGYSDLARSFVEYGV